MSDIKKYITILIIGMDGCVTDSNETVKIKGGNSRFDVSYCNLLMHDATGKEGEGTCKGENLALLFDQCGTFI